MCVFCVVRRRGVGIIAFLQLASVVLAISSSGYVGNGQISVGLSQRYNSAVTIQRNSGPAIAASARGSGQTAAAAAHDNLLL